MMLDWIILVSNCMLIAFEGSIDEEASVTAKASLDEDDQWLVLS